MENENMTDEQLINALFGEEAADTGEQPAEVVEAAKAVIEQPETVTNEEPAITETQTSLTDEKLQQIIDAIRVSTEEGNRQAEMLVNRLTPQEPEPELTEEEQLINDEVMKRLAPMQAEISELKGLVSSFYQREKQRIDAAQEEATAALVADMKAKYEDFNPAIIGAQMREAAQQLVNTGIDPEIAAQAVRTLFDNPAGVEALYFQSKGFALPAAKAPETRTPDEHISGTSAGATVKSWKDKLKSEDERERESAINDLF